MKFAEVLDTDMKFFGQMINMLQVGEYSLSGKDVCASSDTIRWFQRVATQAAECYSQSKTSPKDPPQAVATSEQATSGLPDGVTVKAFNPGKIGRSK